MFIHDQIRNHFLESRGLVGREIKPPLESLAKTEWSSIFEQLMRNRLMMGALRYGLLHDSGKPNYKRTESIEWHLKMFKETGNAEHLVDIANQCLAI